MRAALRFQYNLTVVPLSVSVLLICNMENIVCLLLANKPINYSKTEAVQSTTPIIITFGEIRAETQAKCAWSQGILFTPPL